MPLRRSRPAMYQLLSQQFKNGPTNQATLVAQEYGRIETPQHDSMAQNPDTLTKRPFNHKEAFEENHKFCENGRIATASKYLVGPSGGILSIDSMLKERSVRNILHELHPSAAPADPAYVLKNTLHGVKKHHDTGSGKTLAYLLPIFENLARAKFKHTYGTGAIIIAPTRELCTQIHDLASKFAVKHSRSCVLLISGSGGFNDEQRKLHKGAAIVIATPGRLLQHLEESEKFFSFKVLVTVVLDEADRMIKDGFTSQLKQIFNKLRESNETMNLKRSASTSNNEPVLFPRQVITATATVSTEVNELLSILNVPARRSVDIVTSKTFVTNSTLNQKYMVVSSENRLSVLINFLRVHRESKIMVFMSTCKCVSFYQCVLSSVFAFDNIVTLSGQMEQKERLKIFFNFCKTSQLILICTDVAARGLDIKSVDYIIQYDAPYSAQDYIHRVGRTARAGSAGRSILFLRQEELTFCEVLIKHKILIKEQPNVKFLHPDCNIQLQEFLDTNAYLYEMAVNAFRTYLRFYNSYPNKSCFDISKLDFQNLSYSFGFRKRPDITGLEISLLAISACRLVYLD
ncbi:hypothetical protein GJ496_010370 [Pomphorhynchus laevis]|nr:hypothetical protein GJ496_010370 [Pomphorhynchus laevis]